MQPRFFGQRNGVFNLNLLQIFSLKINRYLFFILLLFSAQNLMGQKTDSLYHINGNILLGEIKKMEYGQLEFKMDGMGTIKVNVEKIKTIKSKKLFEINMEDGRTIYGFIDSNSITGTLKVNSGYDSIPIQIAEIIEIFPLKNTFFLRTSGKIDLGFNYTKASNIGRFNVDWNLTHRTKKTSLSIDGSNVQTFTPNDTVATTSKYDFSLNLERKIKNHWSWISYVSASQNTELALDLRLKGAVGILSDVFHSNIQRFYVIAAAVPNYEVANNKTSKTYNFEAQFTMSYEVFKRTDPEISVSTNVDYFKSFTRNRHRLDYNMDARVEIINNFYVGIKFYYNFDSNPASETAANDDFGFTTTLGYSFN